MRKNLIQRPRDHLIYQFLCLLLFPALFLLLLLYRVFYDITRVQFGVRFELICSLLIRESSTVAE